MSLFVIARPGLLACIVTAAWRRLAAAGRFALARIGHLGRGGTGAVATTVAATATTALLLRLAIGTKCWLGGRRRHGRWRCLRGIGIAVLATRAAPTFATAAVAAGTASAIAALATATTAAAAGTGAAAAANPATAFALLPRRAVMGGAVDTGVVFIVGRLPG